MKSPFANLFSYPANVPRTTQRRLTALVESGVADELLDAVERKTLVARTAQVEKKSQLDKAYAAGVGKIAKGVSEAQRAHEASVRAMHEAHNALMQANAAAYAFDHAYQVGTFDADRVLLESADPRLAEMLAILSQLDDDARNKLVHHYLPTGNSRFHGARFKYFNNLEEIDAARALLKDCMARCREMQLMPISSKDVLTALSEMFALLVDVLAPLNLKAPIIKDGEVVDPSRL